MLPQPLQHPFFCLPACLHWWWWWWFASLSRDEENSNNPPKPTLPFSFQFNNVDAIFTPHFSFSTSRWFVTLIFLSSPIFLIVWYFDMRQKRFYSRLCSLCALAFPKKENFIIDSSSLIIFLKDFVERKKFLFKNKFEVDWMLLRESFKQWLRDATFLQNEGLKKAMKKIW